jgi:hypothetical protein
MRPSRSLEEHLAGLPTEAPQELRSELLQVLATLREADNPIGALLGLSRLTLQLLRLIYRGANQVPPSDNLFDCLVAAGRGDPALKVRGHNIIPDEITSGLHTIRILSNKADHAVERVKLTRDDAENALRLYLRALDWYCQEAEFGPRLPVAVPGSSESLSLSSWRRKRVFASWRKKIFAASIVMLALLVVLAVVLNRKPQGEPDSQPEPTEVPPPIKLPDWARDLPSYPVLQLLASGSPDPPSGVIERPELYLTLLGRREVEQVFHPLADGDELASERDDYLILVEPRTRGYLYVFQVDSSGRLAWLFPENEGCRESSGSNPVSPGAVTWVPAKQLGSLHLDRMTGTEHVFVVMSSQRWGQLEAALRETFEERR